MTDDLRDKLRALAAEGITALSGAKGTRETYDSLFACLEEAAALALEYVDRMTDAMRVDELKPWLRARAEELRRGE